MISPLQVLPPSVYFQTTTQSLSEELGFTYNVTVASSSVTSDEVLDWVAEGTFDLVASWTTVNADRMERVSFSFPYFWTGLSFVYRYQVSEKVGPRLSFMLNLVQGSRQVIAASTIVAGSLERLSWCFVSRGGGQIHGASHELAYPYPWRIGLVLGGKEINRKAINEMHEVVRWTCPHLVTPNRRADTRRIYLYDHREKVNLQISRSHYTHRI